MVQTSWVVYSSCIEHKVALFHVLHLAFYSFSTLYSIDYTTTGSVGVVDPVTVLLSVRDVSYMG